jgi:hypothetical protein
VRVVVLAQEAHQNPLLNGKQIFSYLSKPLYRVLKYHAILKEIFGNVPEGYPARGIVCVCVSCVSCVRVRACACLSSINVIYFLIDSLCSRFGGGHEGDERCHGLHHVQEGHIFRPAEDPQHILPTVRLACTTAIACVGLIALVNSHTMIAH